MAKGTDKHYLVDLTPEALSDLGGITDARVRERIAARIDKLESDPELQGKPLTSVLKGYRSVRAAGQRYRIVYKVERDIDSVVVVVIGIRMDGGKKDAYNIAGHRLGERRGRDRKPREGASRREPQPDADALHGDDRARRRAPPGLLAHAVPARFRLRQREAPRATAGPGGREGPARRAVASSATFEGSPK